MRAGGIDYETVSIQSKEEKRLDEIIGRLQMNLSNNYKDSAQANLAELRETYDEMC